MASWTRDKVNSIDINYGNEYVIGDRVSIEQLNSMVNAGLYVQDFVEALADTPDISEVGNVGIAKVEIVDNIKNGKTYKKFKFSNLKGEKGETGDKGADGAGVTINGVPSSIDFTSNPQTQINNINATLGNISSLLDTINGEVI